MLVQATASLSESYFLIVTIGWFLRNADSQKNRDMPIKVKDVARLIQNAFRNGDRKRIDSALSIKVKKK